MQQRTTLYTTVLGTREEAPEKHCLNSHEKRFRACSGSLDAWFLHQVLGYYHALIPKHRMFKAREFAVESHSWTKS